MLIHPPEDLQRSWRLWGRSVSQARTPSYIRSRYTASFSDFTWVSSGSCMLIFNSALLLLACRTGSYRHMIPTGELLPVDKCLPSSSGSCDRVLCFLLELFSVPWQGGDSEGCQAAPAIARPHPCSQRTSCSTCGDSRRQKSGSDSGQLQNQSCRSVWKKLANAHFRSHCPCPSTPVYLLFS